MTRKATLEFDLDIPDDADALARMLASGDLACTINHMDNTMRNAVKHGMLAGAKLTPAQIEVVQTLRDILTGEINEREIRRVVG